MPRQSLVKGRLRCCTAALVTVAAVTAGCGPSASLEPLPSDARLLAFGNSLTHGTGAGAGASYPTVLARLLDREVVESGVPGELSGEGRRRLPGVLDRVRPDLVLLCHGGNDILRGRDPAAIARNLEAMIAAARARDIPVVLIGVPGRELFTDTADLYYDVAERTGVPLEDEAIERIVESPQLRSDRVHPNAAGYRVLAQAIRDLLVEAGAVARRRQ